MPRRLHFFLFQRKIIFSISFLIFWNSINLPMYHSLETRIWFRIIFLPVKKSLALFQIWVFCQPSIILSHLELSRIDLPKLTSSILMEIVTIPVVLVDEFYMHHPVKAWLFEKIIFELVYLFHIALKSRVSF